MGVVVGEDVGLTIVDRYDVVDNLHGRTAVQFFVNHVHHTTLRESRTGSVLIVRESCVRTEYRESGWL